MMADAGNDGGCWQMLTALADLQFVLQRNMPYSASVRGLCVKPNQKGEVLQRTPFYRPCIKGWCVKRFANDNCKGLLRRTVANDNCEGQLQTIIAKDYCEGLLRIIIANIKKSPAGMIS